MTPSPHLSDDLLHHIFVSFTTHDTTITSSPHRDVSLTRGGIDEPMAQPPLSTSTPTSSDEASRRGSVFWGPPVQLEDHEGSDVAVSDDLAATSQPPPIADGIEGAIGNTPLINIKSLSEATGRVILAKAEFLNGAGQSPKDRVALSMIRTAEEAGLLVPGRGDTIYEGTVGSTGIALTTLARARGYRCHICMPDDMAVEKSDLLHRLGATVERVAVAPITSPAHFVNRARRLAAAHADTAADGSTGFFADQFENPANWRAHFEATGPEIWAQTDGRLDAFVAGAGTGGTITGVARYLKDEARADALRVVLADPQGSGLYNKIRHGVDTMVEGIGITRITANFEAGRDLVDDAVRVTDDQACRMARWLVEKDGIFVGSSSAVNCAAAVVEAMRLPEGSRHIAEMGLEDNDDKKDLFSTLGLTVQTIAST
ncbi:Cysteine synthase 2 like protein [Verticillium longisporum]|nr:Cysteine synthase 2 like protein [Verticillium longisporum]